MALFGIQFVLSITVATFLQKLSPYLSPARWILCNGWLIRYLHPTDDQLKALIGKPTATTKGNRKRTNNYETRKGSSSDSTYGTDNTFTIPCSLDIQLEKAKLAEFDVLPQFLYSDYKWLIDFSCSAAVLNILIEAFACFFPAILSQEFNLGLFWNLLVILFSLKVLLSLTAAYWRGEDTGERSICLTFGLFFFVAAMAVLVVDESLLDFKLDAGYEKFSKKAADFLKKQGFSSREPAPIWVFKFMLAIASAVLGAFMGFPGMRVANMYLDSLYYCRETKYMVALLHLNFLSPLFLLLTWITPIVKDPLVTGEWHTARPKATKLIQNEPKPLMSESMFDGFRIGLVVFFCIVRLCLTWRHLQSYLDMAQERMEKLKRETGRITNIDLQRKVAGVFYYLSAATLQYLAPTVLILFTALVLRTIEFTDWSAIPEGGTSRLDYSNLISNSTREAALSLRGVLSPELFQGVFSYLLWWMCSSWFITSVFGVIYLKMINP
ncbi:transmembrane protein 161B-like [Actinia tenebrosa]|uniref:Transmembrane protein 161B-like n=1 Tax=Actinia tenebrosa TaxID=6105 RepID=A0A6P8IKB6_ACTTE|nr:transmembrane protein 161B-like [Actinia tenebrosa]